jgi:uncharacterized membrane protein
LSLENTAESTQDAKTPGAKAAEDDAKETGRIEAFSDGVFAIAITLLVLEIHVPVGPNLKAAVIKQWPSFLAYVVSFLIVLVMWVNHHAVFRLLRKTDRWFELMNGVLLMLVTFVNYPTALVAAALGTDDEPFAVLLYNGTCFLVAVLSYAMWRYASRSYRLLNPRLEPAVVRKLDAQYWVGPPLFMAVFAITYLNALVGLLGNLALWLYFAFTAKTTKIAN